MYYTWKELCDKYNWKYTYKKKEEKISYARGNGIEIKLSGTKRKGGALEYEIIQEYKTYSRDEIIELFNLQISENTKGPSEFVRYCKNRGIIIEKVGLKDHFASFIIKDKNNYVLNEEIWKKVDGTSLWASNLGRIKNDSGKIKALRSVQGYLYTTDGVYKKTWRVHRLVMLAFNPVDNSDNLCVDHINGIRDDNRIENLRWVSSQRNTELRDENQNKIGALVAELINEYGYDEIYKYLAAKRKPKEK